MQLYFAYGSNMSPRQMQSRCPGARPFGAARLDGWRFIISQRGGANLVRARGGSVWGVLWRVRGEHIAALNGWEGVDQGVYRRCFVTVEAGGRQQTAVTYVSSRWWPGFSSVRYMMTAILPGAEAFGLSADYRRELLAWLPRRPIGPRRQRYAGKRSRAVRARARRPASQ